MIGAAAWLAGPIRGSLSFRFFSLHSLCLEAKALAQRFFQTDSKPDRFVARRHKPDRIRAASKRESVKFEAVRF